MLGNVHMNLFLWPFKIIRDDLTDLYPKIIILANSFKWNRSWKDLVNYRSHLNIYSFGKGFLISDDSLSTCKVVMKKSFDIAGECK